MNECAVFAARKEFELLKLLASDKKILKVALRLGIFCKHKMSAASSAAGGAAWPAAPTAADGTSAAEGGPHNRRSDGMLATTTRRAQRRKAYKLNKQSKAVGAAADTAVVSTAEDAGHSKANEIYDLALAAGAAADTAANPAADAAPAAGPPPNSRQRRHHAAARSPVFDGDALVRRIAELQQRGGPAGPEATARLVAKRSFVAGEAGIGAIVSPFLLLSLLRRCPGRFASP